MRLGTSMQVGMQGGPHEMARRVADIERAGGEFVWLGEGYGFDVPSALGYLASVTDRVQLGSGILNAFSRTPAALAQTAAGLDWLSGGRHLMGLGTSGPQVIEGFHGVPFVRPVERIVDIMNICRALWRREAVQYEGAAITLPLPPGEGTGLGKPIKLVNHPVRSDIPIWWGSLGPRAVEATAEHADGWLTYLLIPEKLQQVWGEPLARGLARRSPERGPLEIQAGVKVAIGDHVDPQPILDALRPTLALYVGGMGARGRNFYNDLAHAYGFHDAATRVQDLYLSGERARAAAEVPTEWLEAMCLVGPPGLVRERLSVLREAGVTQLAVDAVNGDTVGTMEHLRQLLDT